MAKLVDRLLSRGMAFVHDLLMIPVAWLGAYLLRFNLEGVPDFFWTAATESLLLVLPVQAGLFWLSGLYRGVWRFASLPDVLRILKGVGLGVLALAATLLLTEVRGVPRSVPVLYGILLALLISGPRFLYRMLKDHGFRMRSGTRVLIIGAGRAGEMLVRDLLRDRERRYTPVAFLDDEPRRWGRDIHGIRVMGSCAELPKVARRLSIEVIVLAVPAATSVQMKRLVELAEATGIPFRTVPQLNDLVSGQVRIDALREVEIEDLLGRQPISLDWDGIRDGLASRRVMVTGAGGSIGAELCRQLVALGVQELVLVENSEFNLFEIDRQLRQRDPNAVLHLHLVDVRNPERLGDLFASHRPEVVFHAAAYKHVPLLESQVLEAVQNNVLGTANVARMADRYGCREFILISTDKAVNPVNVMGATKRVAEAICHSLSTTSDTAFITVRFGNVLGSTGSVVPLFKEQIRAGGPVTVTHPDITRYFMTTREACQLIMQASVLGRGGEIFVLDMGEPVRIAYLAEQLILLSGKTPGEDIQIQYTGLRPGEKLFEELFHSAESQDRTGHEKIFLAQHRVVDWDALAARLELLRAAVSARDAAAAEEELWALARDQQLAEPARAIRAIE